MAHYQHEDCIGCRFIRSAKCGTVDTDWYICGKGPLHGSVIGRYGDSPSAYWSMPIGVLESAPKGGGSAFFETARSIVAEGVE